MLTAPSFFHRGNWRRESTTAPSLLTKSGHDIDLLLWLLAAPPSPFSPAAPHLPARISSTGALRHFRRARKPPAAGAATNCLSCPIERDCHFSARKIYVDRHLRAGNTGWPVKIVLPEIEDAVRGDGGGKAGGEEEGGGGGEGDGRAAGLARAERLLLARLAEDWPAGANAADARVAARPWFGRCAWESDNDVCDEQVVTMEWDDRDAPTPTTDTTDSHPGGGAKTATMRMVAFTEAICERRGRVYGSLGEIAYDGSSISVYLFRTGETTTHHPRRMGGGHGGGDEGLAVMFARAVDAVVSGGGKWDAERAQREFLGCGVEEVVASHAVVWAAEEARRSRRVVEWEEWWERVRGEKAGEEGVEGLVGSS